MQRITSGSRIEPQPCPTCFESFVSPTGEELGVDVKLNPESPIPLE